jgi:hypothetical protein
MFEDLDLFKLVRKSHSELERILERIENGEMEGTWEVKKIDEPDMKGYTIRGRFGLDESLPPLEPIEPLKPSKRRPSPNKLFELPKAALEERYANHLWTYLKKTKSSRSMSNCRAWKRTT